MSRLTIPIIHRYARELSYRLSVILDDSEMIQERVDDCSVTKVEMEVAMRELDARGGSHSFSTALWQVLAEEARCCDDIGNTCERIRDAINGIPRVKRKPVDRPARAAGNTSTKYFSNTSRFPDAEVKAMITFILEGGRLPAECRVVIEQGTSLFCSGRAGGASKSRNYARGRVSPNATAKGGSIYVCANREHRQTKIRGGHGGYLPIRVNGSTEDFFSVLAHEIRHVFQGYKPIYRECKKVRKHTFGTNAKLCEIDASLFEIRALRRFRREWPSVAHSVLPLP